MAILEGKAGGGVSRAELAKQLGVPESQLKPGGGTGGRTMNRAQRRAMDKIMRRKKPSKKRRN